MKLSPRSQNQRLRVISTNVHRALQQRSENLPEIDRQLRVSNVLEGSVQKAGDRVHINVQLIQATMTRIYGASYDRQLIDISEWKPKSRKVLPTHAGHAFTAGKSACRDQTHNQCRCVRALFARPRLSNATGQSACRILRRR